MLRPHNKLSYILSLTLAVCAWLLSPLLSIASAKYNISYRLLTQEDGLANRNVNVGLQSSRGFIWLGTKDGLNRYDGSRFILFTKEKNHLQDNNVMSLCEDQNQKLWVLYGQQGVNNTSGGKVDILDIKTYEIIPFNKYFGQTAPFRQDQIIGISVNRNHEIFIYCNDGFVYLYKGKQFSKLNTGVNLKERGSRFSFINYATDKGLWLRYDYFIKKDGGAVGAPYSGNGYHVMYYNGADEMMMMYNGLEKELDYSNVKYISVSSKGVKEVKPDLSDEAKRIYYRICKRDFYVVLGDNVSSNTVVYDSRECLYLYKNNELIPLIDTAEARKMPSLFVSHVFSDNEGKLWVCTSVGVMIFKIGPNRFTHYLNSADFKLSGEKPDYQVRGIYADTLGNVYISSTTGAYYINEKSGKQNVKKIIDAPYMSPMVYDAGKYYFGHRGLYEYDPVTGEKKVLFIVGNFDIIWTVYRLSESNWWMSDRSDFYLVKNKIYHPIIDKSTGDILKEVWVHQFFKDREGKQWVVSSKGLYQMENDSIAMLHWNSSKKGEQYLPFDDIHNVWEDDSGDFWLATNGDGLYRWLRKENKFLHFTIADGLSSNLLYGILGDAKDFLWISSDNGLIRFNKKDYSIKVYTTKDGLTNNEFNRLSYFKAADGKMYFGGLDGVNAFYPKDFWNDNKPFAAHLQAISFNQFVAKSNKLEDRTSDLLRKKRIILNPGDNFFTIEFALLDYEVGKHRYAYKIEGIDKDWNYIDINSVRISRPPYGEYTIRIKGANNEGQWSSKELAIPLSVIAPFYMRTWFIVTAILIMGIILVGYARFRVWQYKRRNIALEKVVDSRTTELKTSLQQKEMLLKEIHHRVKNNLQVISGLLQLQSWNVNDENAKKALLEGHNRVLSIALIHQKLYQNEELDVVEFGTFADELFTQISGVFFESAGKVKFNNQVHDLLISIDTAVPLGLVLNELMTNSFKYAFRKVLSPEITLDENRNKEYLILTYSDNGPGLPIGIDFEETSSLGMKLITGLTKQIRGKVEFSNKDGAMARFYIPLKILKTA